MLQRVCCEGSRPLYKLKHLPPAADRSGVEQPLPDPAALEPVHPILELLPALDAADGEEEEPENAVLSEDERLQTSDPLKLYVRQIGDGRLLDRKSTRLNSS